MISPKRFLSIKDQRISWYLLAFVTLAAAHQSASAEPAAAAEGKFKVIELPRGGLRGDSALAVEADPIYQKPKRFRGVSLMSFLERHGVPRGSSDADWVVEFLCEDGYNPIAPLSTLARDEAFLATSDTDAATGREWVPFSYGKGQREPGPFYLVWPNSPADADHPWPYGVVALRIGARNALLGPALPRSEEFRRGFDLFQDHCMKCHSLNGVGGLVGVELNVPKNITEYWKAEELAAFVAKPESFRRNGKMPGFEHLGEETITEILKYIQHMGRHKLSPNEQGSGGK